MSALRAADRCGPESEVVRIAAGHLESRGYRVYVDPDGTSYFDLVARRGAEVGLVEAKAAGAREVLAQALKRRAWGDWVSVVVGSLSSGRRLMARTQEARSSPVGVWVAREGALTVLREPRAWCPAGGPDPFAPLRERFRRILDGIDSGELPSGVRWDGVIGEVRRASGGRGFAEWRLDEGPGGTG